METRFTNRIAEVAKEIAKRENENFSFMVNEEGVIEGCRNRKTSEVYEYSVSKERFLLNTVKMGDIEGIIEEAIEIVKGENQIVVEEKEKVSASEEMNNWYKELTSDESIERNVIDTNVEGFENAEITEDEENYYIDLRMGFGEGIYPKDSFTIEEAIEDQINLWQEQS